jgi:outer membrane protein assembly factor BamB
MKTTHALFAACLSALLGVSLALTGCQPAPSTASENGGEQAPADDKQGDKQPDVKPQVDENAVAQAKPVAVSSAVAAALGDKSSNGQIKPGDVTMWGMTSYRNNVPEVSNSKAIPIDWDIGGFDRKTGDWFKEKSQNIKWVAAVGSQTYGNPVVAGGKVFVGTNNGTGYLKRFPAEIDLGCMLCFSEADGSFLWQHSSEKLATGRVHDWPLQGICCAPYVEGDRMWFVSSRGNVVCCDTEGFYDGEDDGEKIEWARLLGSPAGPDDDSTSEEVAPAAAALKEGVVNEWLRGIFAARGMPLPEMVEIKAGEKPNSWEFAATIDGIDRKFRLDQAGPRLNAYYTLSLEDKHEADTIWTFDMMKPPLGVSQHNMCSCSITALGDILFVNTSNGLDESHVNLPAPDAPSFIAMDKNTAEVYWTDKSPGTNILHGQWSSPAVGMIGGEPQVIFAGGDGWVYSFQADKGVDGKPTLLWTFDANPKTSKWELGGRGTRNNIIATPVIYDGLVYVAVGQDPEHAEGVGHLWCIDPTKRGNVSAELAMKLEGDKRVEIPHKRIQAVIEEEGEIAVENPNSAAVWHYSEFDQNGNGKISFEEQMHRSCGTVAIKDDFLYISDFSGLFHCLNAKTGKVHWTYDMLAAAWGSPLIVNGHVYIGDEDGDISIFELGQMKPAPDEEIEPIAELSMDNSVYSTPIVANDVLYIANKTHVFAIVNQDAGGE